MVARKGLMWCRERVKAIASNETLLSNFGHDATTRRELRALEPLAMAFRIGIQARRAITALQKSRKQPALRHIRLRELGTNTQGEI
jgi:hypothetical protein